MNRSYYRFVLALPLLLCAMVSQAQMVLEITRGNERPIPIAVVPFGWDRPETQKVDIAQVVADDLQRSGRFAPLDGKEMDRKGMKDRPTSGPDIRFQEWKSFWAVDYILVGKVVNKGGEQTAVQLELYNTQKASRDSRIETGRLIGTILTTSVPKLRSVGHQIADLVYQELTGTPGAFATRIAFIRVTGSPPTQHYELVVADSDSENQTSIFRSDSPIMSPSWSPDGKSLAYVSFEHKIAAIIVQNVATAEQRRVSARAGINGAPAWSPDGKTMALTLSRKDGDVDVYTLDLATQVLTRMTFDPGIDTEPTWSIDGKKIYFTSDRGGSPQIYEIDVSDPRSPRRITFDGTYNARPRISPDGKKLALVHRESGSDRIGILELATKSLRTVTNGRDDEGPSFAPNGAMIIYATQLRGRSLLKIASSTGSFTGEFRLEGDVREPAWGPFPDK
jgi:TolB protein